MHPKVAGAIQEIDAALFNGDTFDDPDDRAELVEYVRRWSRELGLELSDEDEASAGEPSEGLRVIGKAGADFIRARLHQPSPSAAEPVQIRRDGSWTSADGVVHAVNATWIHPDIDLGRETACGVATWDPDSPRSYPAETESVVDCMTCIVQQARSCP